jgi:hypothetical protein
MPSNQSGPGAFFHSFAQCGQSLQKTARHPWLRTTAGKADGTSVRVCTQARRCRRKGSNDGGPSHIGMPFRAGTRRTSTQSPSAQGRYFGHNLCANFNVTDCGAFVKWSRRVFTINFHYSKGKFILSRNRSGFVRFLLRAPTHLPHKTPPAFAGGATGFIRAWRRGAARAFPWPGARKRDQRRGFRTRCGRCKRGGAWCSGAQSPFQSRGGK